MSFFMQVHTLRHHRVPVDMYDLLRHCKRCSYLGRSVQRSGRRIAPSRGVRLPRILASA